MVVTKDKAWTHTTELKTENTRASNSQLPVAQQIVVHGEELHVELGQRQHGVARVVARGQDVLVPHLGLGGIQRQRVHGLQLRLAPLVHDGEHLDEDLREKRDIKGREGGGGGGIFTRWQRVLDDKGK